MEESNIPPLKKKTYITIEEASEKNPGQTISIQKFNGLYKILPLVFFGFKILLPSSSH